MFVFELPFPAEKALAEILDVDDNGWEQLACRLQLTSSQVTSCRTAAHSGRSRTTELLRAWACGGYTVDQLYAILAVAGQKRAMLVLNDYVDRKHHKLLKKFDMKLVALEVQPAGSSPTNGGPGQPHSPISIENTPVASGASWKPVSSSLISGSNNNQQQLRRPCSSSASTAPLQPHSDLLSTLQSTISVPFQELHEATNGFSQSNVVGKGSYGVVYKAEWKHSTVAVKRIVISKNSASSNDPNRQASQQERERLRQSLIELKTLTLYRHDNVLPLYGFSLDGPDPCLIYQFMPGGSLEDRLLCKRDQPALRWRQRLSVVRGSCRGLHFLHTITAKPLIHGDIKTANILLDTHDEPKLGDFGLATTGQVELPSGDVSPLIASHVKGTLAYLPPEFIRSKHVSSKLDVYSFGVVLLEIATGLRAYTEQRRPQALVDYVETNLQKQSQDDDDSSLIGLADVKAGVEDVEVFWVVLNAGRRSCERNPALRPSIGDLIVELNHIDDVAVDERQ